MAKPQDSTANALIHPLVVMNISEHWTRLGVQHGTPKPVFGVLLGKQIGRGVEIVNSFELKVAPDQNGKCFIDEEFFTQREALYKEVFATLETIGWYTTGNHEKASELDEHFHRQIMVRHESPIMLKLNTESPTVVDKVSHGAFESIVDPSNESALIFVPLNVKIISEHSEQIGIDHVARITNTGDPLKQLNAQLDALNMLIQRMETIVDYLKAVLSGALPRNDTVLSETFKLCQRLNNLKMEAAESLDDKQELDHKLVVLLSAMTCIQAHLKAECVGNRALLFVERANDLESNQPWSFFYFLPWCTVEISCTVIRSLMRGISLSKKLLSYHCSCSRNYATSTQTSSNTVPIILEEDTRHNVMVDDSKGLFLIDILRNSWSFRMYYAEIFNKNCDIKKMILEKAKDPAPKSIYEKTFIQLVDELANDLTTACLVARVVNKIHPKTDWAAQGKHYIAKFKELEENLKNNMDIYDALRFSLKTDIGWIDSVDVRAIEAYLEEFREYGAHLDLDEDRKEQRRLQNRLAYTSETFIKNCQKTNDYIGSYNLLYGYLLGRLGGVQFDSSMVLDKEGLKYFHKFNLNNRPRNWKEFWQSVEMLRVTDIIVNFQENRRLFNIKPFLAVDRKKFVEDLLDKPAPAFTRWVYNHWLLEEREEQEFYLRRIVRDCYRTAEITGHESFAHRVQANTLLRSYDKVKKFLEDVIKEFQPHVEPELEEIRHLTKTRHLEEADVQFALEASRYRSSLNHDLHQKMTKMESLRFESVLRGLISHLQKLYDVKIQPEYAGKGESWQSAVLKLEVSDAKEELLGAIYVNVIIKRDPLGATRGRKMLSELNLDMEKDVEFYPVRKPKLLQNGELQTSISVVSLTIYVDDFELGQYDKVYLHPRTAKNFYREMGQAMRLILAQPRHQIFTSSTTIASDLQEIPSFFMEQLFYHTYSTDSDLAEVIDETKYRFRALKTIRTAVNGLLDLQLQGDSAFDYINDQTLTSTKLFHEIHKKALPQIKLRKNIGPQHRLQDLAVRPAQVYSPLVAKSCASLIWKSQFESCPDFYKEQGKKWSQFQSKFGEDAAQDLLKSYFGFVIEPELLVDTLKNESIRPTAARN